MTRRRLLTFAVGWTAFAVYGSLVPLHYTPTKLSDAIERFRNLPPLWFGMGTRADWVANILLFIPLTFSWMGTLSYRRGHAARIVSAMLIVPAAAFAAVALEFTQIWFPPRTVTSNDILAETIGGIVGVALWFGVGESLVAWLKTYAVDQQPRSQLRWLLQAYLIGFIGYSVVPLDLTISLAELYHKYQRGQIILVPFSYHYESLGDAVYSLLSGIVLFIPIGAWVVFAARDRGRTRAPLLTGIIGGALIATAIEIVQLLVVSRYSSVTDIILGTVGAGVGAWLVVVSSARVQSREARPRGRDTSESGGWLPWLAAIAIYSLFLIAGFWYPFEFTTSGAVVRPKLEGFFRVPFLALYIGTEFNALKQLLVRVLLFAPIGAMWAYVAALARTAAASRLVLIVGFVYATALAFGIEIVEVLMPSKVADSTEVALCMAGALAGSMIVWRLLGTWREDQ